jgi:carbonic anhydrase
LIARNADLAAQSFTAGLRINPLDNVMVIGCVDPRVDPAHVLGLAHGEAAVIRNVGGRITPATLRTMGMLAKVGQANADGKASGDWHLVVLHHTDCGMIDLAPWAGRDGRRPETATPSAGRSPMKLSAASERRPRPEIERDRVQASGFGYN